jgi:hypothetical protein
MNIPLMPDLTNQKWLILQEILKSIDSNRGRKIASRLKIPDLQVFIDCMKILILAETFELDYYYVVSEIKENNKLIDFMRINNLLETKNIYKYVSKLDSADLNTFFKSIFKISKNSHKIGKKYVIIDTSAIPIDINTWRKKNKIGKDKKYQWSYSASSGYYVGYKLILAIDAETFKILGFEIYKNSPHDSKLLEKFVEKLCNSRKLRQGDAVICDRGFTAKKNYHILMSRFLLVPIIFARKNTNVKRIMNTLTPPLDIWNGKKYFLEIWKRIINEFCAIIEIWKVFREIRSNIELFFNVVKNCVGFKKAHQFTEQSLLKRVIRALHLTFELIRVSKRYNIGVRELAEM